jgi:hypothetical protein
MPRHALTPKLAEILASALIYAGRYRDAREVAQFVTGDAHELLLARIERRTGDYAPALSRLDRIAARGFEAAILRADLFYIDARYDEMRVALEECAASTEEERAQLAYQRALLAFELHEPIDDQPPPSHYLASRLATYLCSRDDLDAAAGHAAQSLERARCETERIDAALDRVYILFTAGAWAEARDEALRALALVEETQGDRAGGGILFILAYLAADDGHWTHAAQRLHRLRHFYRGTGDDKRLRELDLIAAHLDFSRGRFSDAARSAQAIIDSVLFSPQIREAASLILDEIDWIEAAENYVYGAVPPTLEEQLRSVHGRLVFVAEIFQLLSAAPDYIREELLSPPSAQAAARFCVDAAADVRRLMSALPVGFKDWTLPAAGHSK